MVFRYVPVATRFYGYSESKAKSIKKCMGGDSYTSFVVYIKKWDISFSTYVPLGAEKRIRTSGRFTAVTRFPIVLLKPLRHLCKPLHCTRIRRKMQPILWGFAEIFQNFPKGRQEEGGIGGEFTEIPSDFIDEYTKIVYNRIEQRRKFCRLRKILS